MPTLSVKFHARGDETALVSTVLGVLLGSPGILVAIGTVVLQSGVDTIEIIPEFCVSAKTHWDITMVPQV